MIKWIASSLPLFFTLFSYGQEGKPLPSGIAGKPADQLAQKMSEAVNCKAWDNTPFVQWTFVGKRSFVWDKFNGIVKVSWDENEVILSLKDNTGKVIEKGVETTDEASKKGMIQKALDYFNNDSFWLIAPCKAFDGGTTRQKIEGDQDQLLVTYGTGGSTPGDSYLWTLDASGKPVSWEMWVSIIPKGGVPTTWEDWKKTNHGTWIAEKHMAGENNVSVTDVKTANSLTDLGYSDDYLQF